MNDVLKNVDIVYGRLINLYLKKNDKIRKKEKNYYF